VSYGDKVDLTAVEAAIKLIRRHQKTKDLVERCNLFKLPLTILDDEDRDKVFHVALAELSCCYDTESESAKRLMVPFLGSGELKKFEIDQKYRFSHRKEKILPHAKDMVISMAYPWFSRLLYTSLFRLNREGRLDVTENDSFQGTYRYFRSFPLDDKTFVLRDGRMKVVVDKRNNMISLGHASQNWTGGDFSLGQYEHRGFVVPGIYKTDIISFRGGITRFASIAGGLEDECQGTILTSTRGRDKIPPRPFAAQFLLFKEGHEFEKLEIPYTKLGKETVFDSSHANYKKIHERFCEANRNTVSEQDGFMWGTSADAARRASEEASASEEDTEG
jgi:hypothetical protein